MTRGYKYNKPSTKTDSIKLEAEGILELINQDTGKNGETNIEHYIHTMKNWKQFWKKVMKIYQLQCKMMMTR